MLWTSGNGAKHESWGMTPGPCSPAAWALRSPTRTSFGDTYGLVIPGSETASPAIALTGIPSSEAPCPGFHCAIETAVTWLSAGSNVASFAAITR